MKFTSALVAVILVTLSATTVLVLLSERSEGATLRAPIVILGDGDFTPENGVVRGSGSPQDPYVISGWEIPVRSGSGIAIGNTTASFVISEMHINGTSDQEWPTYGIYLYNVANGRIKNSLLNDTTRGVYLTFCVNCSVQQNELLGVQDGVYIDTCDSTNVVGNHVVGQGGIDAVFWTGSRAYLNAFQWTEVAIAVSGGSGLDLCGNFFDSCQYGLMLAVVDKSTIMGNGAFGGWYGIYLAACTDLSIRANLLALMTATGFAAYSSCSQLEIAYNQFMSCSYGTIWVEDSGQVVIRDNLIENGQIGFGPVGGGVYLENADNVTVYHNNFVSNTPMQAEDTNGPENRWNDSYPSGGNWWSDYAGVDNFMGPLQDTPGSDGIGDVPYPLDPDSIDWYPLMSMWYVNSRPIAEFSVTPASGDTLTLFSLDASNSSDPDEGSGDSIQKYRWDLDGDGNWDTDWSTENVTDHIYPSPGNYTAVLEVVDSNGLASLYEVDIVVTEWVIPEFDALVLPMMAFLLVALVSIRRHRKS